MKRAVLLLGAALTLVSAGVMAEGKPAKKAAAPTSLHCAVMKEGKVNIKDATAKKMYADHKGRRYFFCCAGCPEAFKKEPAKYAKNDSIPTPKK